MRAAFAIALIVVSRAWGQTEWPMLPVPSKSERVVLLEDKRIKESSGLSLSGRSPSIWWTINDSGGEPCVFAIDQKGKTRAKVRIRDAANFDWEDIAIGKSRDGKPVLFVGDIGDNLGIRASIQVYEIPEPEVSPPGESVEETLSAAPKLWRARYPDGKHNAECLLCHPQTRRLYILTKTDDGKCALYAFPEQLESEGSMILEKIADLSFPALIRIGKRPHDNCMTTAADFSPDGFHMLVSTYSSVYEWTIPERGDVAQALKQPPVRIEPDLLPQLEGACYDADGRAIWLTSERLPTPLVRVTR
ncbi:MAG: hypothetical protein R3F13_06615 [Prosthecobacter sp.]